MIPQRAPLTLSAVSDPTQTHALLRDPNGGGLLHLDPSAPAPKLDRSWEDALRELALDKLTSPKLLGGALFQRLTVERPAAHPVTETLPWELPRDDQSLAEVRVSGEGQRRCSC